MLISWANNHHGYRMPVRRGIQHPPCGAPTHILYARRLIADGGRHRVLPFAMCQKIRIRGTLTRLLLPSDKFTCGK